MLSRILSGWMIVILLVFSTGAYSAYIASLNGSQAVPPTQSTATGDAVFSPNRDNTELKCQVTVNNLNNDGSLDVGLYFGSPGEPAHPDMRVATLPLVRSVSKGRYTGILCSVTLTDENLQGLLAGKKIESLIFALGMGKVFINISSGTYPEGEIRGQIQ
jgi:hypothetical protein